MRFEKWTFRMFVTQAMIFLAGATFVMTMFALDGDYPRNELIARLAFMAVVVGTIALMIRELFKFGREVRSDEPQDG